MKHFYSQHKQLIAWRKFLAIISVFTFLCFFLPIIKAQTPEEVRKAQVRKAQEILKKFDYYSGEITGELDDATKKAIEKFQEDKGLKVDGLLGSNTMAALEKAVSPRPQSELKGLQSELKGLQDDIRELDKRVGDLDDLAKKQGLSELNNRINKLETTIENTSLQLRDYTSPLSLQFWLPTLISVAVLLGLWYIFFARRFKKQSEQPQQLLQKILEEFNQEEIPNKKWVLDEIEKARERFHPELQAYLKEPGRITNNQESLRDSIRALVDGQAKFLNQQTEFLNRLNQQGKEPSDELQNLSLQIQRIREERKEEVDAWNLCFNEHKQEVERVLSTQITKYEESLTKYIDYQLYEGSQEQAIETPTAERDKFTQIPEGRAEADEKLERPEEEDKEKGMEEIKPAILSEIQSKQSASIQAFKQKLFQMKFPVEQNIILSLVDSKLQQIEQAIREGKEITIQTNYLPKVINFLCCAIEAMKFQELLENTEVSKNFGIKLTDTLSPGSSASISPAKEINLLDFEQEIQSENLESDKKEALLNALKANVKSSYDRNRWGQPKTVLWVVKPAILIDSGRIQGLQVITIGSYTKEQGDSFSGGRVSSTRPR